MSERDKLENARKKGRRAYLAGVPVADNPMTAPDSRLEWERAWRQEKEIMNCRSKTLKKRANDIKKPGYYFTDFN